MQKNVAKSMALGENPPKLVISYFALPSGSILAAWRGGISPSVPPPSLLVMCSLFVLLYTKTFLVFVMALVFC